MIVANQKPLEEILTMTRGLERLAVIGCNSCVTVCMAGGEKEVAVIASALRLAAEKEGRPLTVEEAIAERQCEDEFCEKVREPGLWMEMCAGCGDCVIHLTGGFCPVARCAKRMLNGPCGGSQDGKCEVDKETDCVWQQIYDRMVSLGRLDELMALQAAKDWRAARDGGPRKRLREDARK